MIFSLAGTKLKPRKYSYTDLPKLPLGYSEWIRPLGEDSALTLDGEFGEYWKMKFEGTCLTKKPSSATTSPRARLMYSVWQKKDGSFLCCFAPRMYAKGIAVLAAASACGGKPKISEIEVSAEDFHQYARYVLERGGEVKWLALREVSFSGIFAKRFELVGISKSSSSSLGSLLKAAKEIQKMGFKLEGILWTISSWGGGQILAPVNPGDEVCLKLLDMIQDTIL